jgi:hypothetical protein
VGAVNERQYFTVGLFALSLLLIVMAYFQQSLWEVKLFEVILQALVITGLLNMAGAFHFAANQQNQSATENTGRAFDALKEVARHGRGGDAPGAIEDGDQVTLNRKDEGK